MELSFCVPQRSILGPILFLLYINDLCVSCSIELFADDSVLYRKIASEGDCVEFQDDPLSASSWCDLRKVTLKSEKCKTLHVAKTKCPLVHQYVINENNLSAVDKHKHLGIWIESSLRWDPHINFIVGKANRVLGLIRRTFRSKDPVQSRQLLTFQFALFWNMPVQHRTHIWLNTYSVLNPSSVVLLD